MRRFVAYLLCACSSVAMVACWFKAAQAAPITTPEPVAALSSVLTEGVKLVFMIVTPLALFAVHSLLGTLKAKYGVFIPQQQEALLDKFVEQGVHLAEEKARQWAKDNGPGIAMGGRDKLATALDYVVDHVRAASLENWTQEQLKAKIEAKVHAKRWPPNGMAP